MSEALEDVIPQFACGVCRAVYRTAFPRCPRDGGVLSPLAVDPLEGTLFVDRYQIEQCVGEGAMGRVYRARHSRMANRIFAVKVMFGDLAADQKMRSRFENEAEASSRLTHKNLVSVVDFGETHDGLVYLVMDFIQGENLADIIAAGPVEEARAVRMLAGVCQGLQHAHDRKLIHRDLKTENILVVKEDGVEIPKVVDFGIAKLKGVEVTDERLTAAGCVVGTPAYMSPEQACGEELDHRTDLFSLGLIIYELLVGKKPFDGTPMEIARQNVSSRVPRISVRNPDVAVSPELEDLVLKLLEKDKEDRPASGRDVVEALQEIYGDSIAFDGAPKPVAKTPPTDPLLKVLVAAATPTQALASKTVEALKDEIGTPRSKVLFGIGAAVAFVALLAVGVMSGGDSGPQESPTALPMAELDVPAEGESKLEPAQPEVEPEPEVAEAAPARKRVDAIPSRPLTKPRTEEPRPEREVAQAERPKKRTTRRVSKSPETQDKPKPRHKSKRSEPKTTPPPPPEVHSDIPVTTGGSVDPSEFSRLYVKVSGMVDRYALLQGESAAAPYSRRFLRINLVDGQRMPALREAYMNDLRKLYRELKPKLK